MFNIHKTRYENKKEKITKQGRNHRQNFHFPLLSTRGKSGANNLQKFAGILLPGKNLPHSKKKRKWKILIQTN